ncbi:MAG: DUF6036 family nucleotidyltransferase [Planctomycetota bacterium]
MATKARHPALPEDFVDDGGPDMWELALNRYCDIDRREVQQAIWRTLARPEEDENEYRTALLLHDTAEVMRRKGWPLREDFPNPRSDEDPDEVGFPSLRSRIVDVVTPQMLNDLFRDLGQAVHRPCTLDVGGSSALILRDLLRRETEDIDVVDELPEVVRTEYAVLDNLARTYKIRLTHFGSHYLPDGFRSRLSGYRSFRRVQVRLVDTYDVLAGKLFSKRSKDKRDLLLLREKVSLDALRERVMFNTDQLRKVPGLAEVAEGNWYVLTGEEALPTRDA